jgi:hypothetical protein
VVEYFQGRQREDEHGEHPGADERRRGAGPDHACLGADGGDDDDQRQGGGGQQGEGGYLVAGGDVPVEERHRAPAHEQEQQQEHRDEGEGRRLVHQGGDVQLDPADHEEERDDEPEADRVELGPDGFPVVRAGVLGSQVLNDARREGAEQCVEPEGLSDP